MFDNENEIRDFFNYRLEPVAFNGEYEGPGSKFSIYFLGSQEDLDDIAAEMLEEGTSAEVTEEIRGLKGYWVVAGPDGEFERFDTEEEAIAAYEEFERAYEHWLEHGAEDDDLATESNPR